MDTRNDIREFLTSRRAKITPDQAGLPAYVRNGRLDILASNAVGAAMYAPVLDDDSGTPNMARGSWATTPAAGSQKP